MGISFTNIFDIINIPLGFILRFCYQLVGNYGLAILLFTLIVRFCLAPLAIKQQKAMANTVRLQPKIEALQKKYKNDRQKLSEAQMKLYQEEGANPMSSCLPLLPQLPILYGLYQVIYHPLRYISQMTVTTVNRVIYDLFPVLQSQYASIYGKMSTPSQALSNGQTEIYAAKLLPANMDKLQFLPHGILKMDFNFLGLDLSAVPGYRISPYLILPILCYVSSFVMTWAGMHINKKNNMSPNAPGSNGMNLSMLVMMPIFSTFFSFTFPVGITIYWIFSNILGLAQIVLLNIFYNPKKLAVQFERESEAKKSERVAKMKARQDKLAALYEAHERAQKGLPPVEKSPEKQAEKDIEGKTEPEILPENLSNKKKMERNKQRLAESRRRAELRKKIENTQPVSNGQNQKKKKKKR